MPIGPTITAPGHLTLRFGEMQLAGITAETFARFAAPGGKVIISNHPAFVFGHLSLYNSRVMDLLGKPHGPAAKPDGWDLLFKAGVECKDDPTGTIYPPMDIVTKACFDGFRHVLPAVAAAPDALLDEPNPAEGRMKEMFPTKGAAIAFMLAAHPMSHFGQVSAWRRMQGLPSAM